MELFDELEGRVDEKVRKKKPIFFPFAFRDLPSSALQLSLPSFRLASASCSHDKSSPHTSLKTEHYIKHQIEILLV